jgi:hypothetical protein
MCLLGPLLLPLLVLQLLYAAELVSIYRPLVGAPLLLDHDLQFGIGLDKLVVFRIVWLAARRTLPAEILFNMMPAETAQLFAGQLAAKSKNNNSRRDTA